MTLTAFAALSLFAAPGHAVLMAARTGVSEGFRTGLTLTADTGTFPRGRCRPARRRLHPRSASNTVAARIFSLEKTRQGCINLKSVPGHSLNTVLAILGITVALR